MRHTQALLLALSLLGCAAAPAPPAAAVAVRGGGGGGRQLQQSLSACASSLSPSAGPVAGGTLVTLVGLTGPPTLCTVVPVFGDTVNVPVASGSCFSPSGRPGSTSSVTVWSSASPALCASAGPFNFTYYPEANPLLSVPASGPRYGVVSLELFPNNSYFARQLSAQQQASFACRLRHAQSGTSVTLPAQLARGGTSLTCATAAGGAPLPAGAHALLLSLNGQDFHGAQPNQASLTQYLALGPSVSLETTLLTTSSSSSSTSLTLAVTARLVGNATTAVALALQLTAGGGGYPAALAPPANSSSAQAALFDYTLLGAPTLVWLPGQPPATRSLRLRVVATSEQRSAKALTLSFDAASLQGADPGDNTTCTVRILNDSPAPSFGVSAPSVAYRGEPAVVSVSPLAGSSALESRIAWTLVGQSGAGGVHFAAASGELVWAGRDAQPKNVSVSVFWDALPLTAALTVGMTLRASGNGGVYEGAGGLQLRNGSTPVLSLFGVPRSTCPPGTSLAPPAPPPPPMARRPPPPPPAPPPPQPQQPAAPATPAAPAAAPPPPPPPRPPRPPPAPSAPPAPATRFPTAPGDSPLCRHCPPGSFAPSANATACALCPPGSYAAAARSLACGACPPGSFSLLLGATSCAPCGVGTSSLPDGSACALCGPGVTTLTGGRAVCDTPLVAPFAAGRADARATLVSFALQFGWPAADAPARWPAAAGAPNASAWQVLSPLAAADLAQAFRVPPGAVQLAQLPPRLLGGGAEGEASPPLPPGGGRRRAAEVSGSSPLLQRVNVTVAVEALLPRDADAQQTLAAAAEARSRAEVGARALTSAPGAVFNSTRSTLSVTVALLAPPTATSIAPPLPPPPADPWARLPLRLSPLAVVALVVAALFAAVLVGCATLRLFAAFAHWRRAAAAQQALRAKQGGERGAELSAAAHRAGMLRAATLHQEGGEETDADGLRLTTTRADAVMRLAEHARSAALAVDPLRAAWAVRTARDARMGRQNVTS